MPTTVGSCGGSGDGQSVRRPFILTRNNPMKYANLIECCERLEEHRISGWWLDPETDKESNHWSSTLGVMRGELGRPLTEEEITCLSLSRGYGPLPCVKDEDVPHLWEVLFPEGNPRGLRHNWGDLADLLRKI